jgi:hypothetical protein
MKQFFLAPLCFALALTFQASCSNSSSGTPAGGGAPPAINVPPTLMVFANRTDPRIIEAGTSNGTKIQFFGEKDSLGVAQNVYAIAIDAQGETTQFDLDTQGLPELIHTPNGAKFFFEWDVDNQTAVLTAIAPDGQNQVSTLVEFAVPIPVVIANAKARQEKAALNALGVQNLEPRGGRATWMTTKFPNAGTVEPLVKFRVVQKGTDTAEVITDVTSCDLPKENLQVLTSVFDDSNNELIGTFPCKPVGAGTFVTSIPQGTIALANTPDNCETIAGVLGTVCTIQSLFGPQATTSICVALSIALDAVTIPSGEAALLSSACLSMAPLIELYCATVGASPVPGAPSVLDMICDAVFQNTPDAAQVRIQTCVIALPSNVCADDQVVFATGGFPVLNTVDLGANPAIRSLVLDPSSPDALEDYVATADFSCLPMDSTVTLSIVGTDGFTDSVSFPIAATQLEGQFDLMVPAAGVVGVQDTVTATLEILNGPTLTKTAFLVFD